jgi:hypothetical protein
MDKGRKRVLLIAASILAARKLAQYDSGARIPATVRAIADSIRQSGSRRKLTGGTHWSRSKHRIRQRQRTMLCAILTREFNV